MSETASRAPFVEVRPAGRRDEATVLAWRNDPVTRAMSRTPDLVDPLAFAAFWTRVEDDPDLRVVIGEADAGPIGTVFFERIDGEWECSINVDPGRRGRGYAHPLLSGAIRCAFPQGAPELRAEIKSDNARSRRLFEGCGFREEHRRGDVIVYLRPAEAS